jgi:hypothetical protein
VYNDMGPDSLNAGIGISVKSGLVTVCHTADNNLNIIPVSSLSSIITEFTDWKARFQESLEISAVTASI